MEADGFDKACFYAAALFLRTISFGTENRIWHFHCTLQIGTYGAIREPPNQLKAPWAEALEGGGFSESVLILPLRSSTAAETSLRLALPDSLAASSISP